MRRKSTLKILGVKILVFLAGFCMLSCFMIGMTICAGNFTANAAVFSAYLNMPEVSVQLIQKGFSNSFYTQSGSSEPASSDALPVSSEPPVSSSQPVSSDSVSREDSSSSESEPVVRPEDSGDIVEETFASILTTPIYTQFGSGCVRNYTSLSISYLNELLQTKASLKLQNSSAPQVLIVHTHATESFQLNDYDFYIKGYNARSTDSSVNMVAVGDVVAEILEDAGIGVLHDDTYHDYPTYNGSYDRSEETIKKYLAEYPTIQVVLDLHRDAIERDDGSRIKPVTEIDGKKAAQIMIIAGCDDGTMNMPNWPENFRFAASLQDELEGLYPTLTRPLMLDYRNYNQHLTKASILIEIGGHANTLNEAKYSAEMLGDALVKLLKGYMQ